MKRKNLSDIRGIIKGLCEKNQRERSEHPNMDAISQGQCEGAMAAYKVCLALLEGTPLSDLLETADKGGDPL